MSTIRTASIRGRGGSTPNSRGGIAAFDAAPELLLCREKEVLVEGVAGIVISTHLPPPVMMESADSSALPTHMLCCS
jgi:hypothetical protein